MFTVILIMVAGVGVGFTLRNKKIPFLSKAINIFILILLFLLGAQVGSNETIMKNLHTIGIEALIITFGALFGSIAVTYLVYVKFFKNRVS